jgi:L-malate glycosyltransferase
MTQATMTATLQAVRAHIKARQTQPGSEAAIRQPHTQRLPAAFYDHLQQARESHNRLHVQPQPGKSRLPLLGPFVERVKQAMHLLVVFYVNKMAGEQTAVNAHLIELLTLLAQEVEQEKYGPATVHIMTAALTPGDAISNYALSCRRILQQQGMRVYLYADHVAPAYAAIARHSRYYPASGDDILWFHYSIYTENVTQATASPDFRIMDFHGISPPHLFAGQNAELEALCRQGLDLLPTLHDKFNRYIVHSRYVFDQLVALDFPAAKIDQIALCIDTTHFENTADPQLVEILSGLNYLLFVGRIVPQKDIIALIEIFYRLSRQRPDLALILVGSREQTRQYQQQLERLLARYQLTDRVLFTGQVNSPGILATLYRQAQLLLVTSEWESFCVPVAESLYFGVPAAVHNVPPLPEVAGPGGIVIDKQNPDQAAQAILAVLNNRAQYEQLCRSAQSWSEQYTDRVLAQRLETFFMAIANTTNTGLTLFNLLTGEETDV